MCGILAVIGDYRYSEIPKALIERGRDGQGIYQDKNVQLIQTRLKITGGEITLPYQNDRYVLLFNGEIYNYKKFDANEYEAILKAFKKYKNNVAKHLDGQFAIIIYDKINNEVFFFNDDFKINCVYYTTFENSLILSSNLRSMPNMKFKSIQTCGYGNVTFAKIL